MLFAFISSFILFVLSLSRSVSISFILNFAVTNDNLCFRKLFSPSGLSTWFVLFKSLLVEGTQPNDACKYLEMYSDFGSGMQREKERTQNECEIERKKEKKNTVRYKLTITVVNKQTDELKKRNEGKKCAFVKRTKLNER